jgi:hypothetical protein
MANTIKWIGGLAMITGAALVAFLTITAPGDVVSIVRGDLVELTNPQKAKLATAILAVHSDVDMPSLVKYYCRRDEKAAVCRGTYTSRVSSSDYANLDIEGKAGQITAINGDLIDFAVELKEAIADKSAIPKIVDFVKSALDVNDISTMIDFLCERKPDNPGVVGCMTAQIKPLAPSAYVAAKQAGKIIKPLGRAE